MKKNLKKVMAYMLLTSVCFGQVVPGIDVKAEEKESRETAYIVTVKSDRAYELLSEEYQSQIDDTVSPELSEEGIMVLSMDEGEAQQLAEDARVETIEEDIVVQACGENEAGSQEMEWNLDALNLAEPEPADYIENRPKIKVALIDSGIDYSEDIDVWERKNFVPGQDEVSVLYEDSTGHGTCIAGILAAKENDLGITGINSNIELYSARVLDSSNTSRVSRIIEAINWAIEKEVNILSLSFGTTTDSEALHNAIKKAYENNILIVAAAGNGEQIEYPAAYPETVAVGSIGTDGVVSESSAAGEELELVAPGEQILSTGAFDGVMTCGGTSMAVPHVVGVASLLWEKDITADAEFIRMVLGASAKTYDDKQNYGYGLVDYGCATAMYDECKEIYESRVYDTYSIETLQQEHVLEENETTLEAGAYEDVDYVEGRWTKEQHQAMAGQKSFSAENMRVIKIGAVANDNYIQGMVAHPQWHGYFKTSADQQVNYVACYMYLTKIAQVVSNGNYLVAKPDYLSDGDYGAMVGVINSSGVNGVPWSIVLGNDTINNKNKMLVVYGMALHIATDIFSHSTFDLEGVRTKHDNDLNKNGIKDAHDEKYCTNRYLCAKEIAVNVLDKIINTSAGTVADFKLSSYNSGTSFEKCFKLKRIATYINSINNSYYKSNKTYFDNMALSSLNLSNIDE